MLTWLATDTIGAGPASNELLVVSVAGSNLRRLCHRARYYYQRIEGLVQRLGPLFIIAVLEESRWAQFWLQAGQAT